MPQSLSKNSRILYYRFQNHKIALTSESYKCPVLLQAQAELAVPKIGIFLSPILIRLSSSTALLFLNSCNQVYTHDTPPVLRLVYPAALNSLHGR